MPEATLRENEAGEKRSLQLVRHQLIQSGQGDNQFGNPFLTSPAIGFNFEGGLTLTDLL
jgi:hypothetical protein